MKTKEEILSEFGCPDIPFDENVTMYYPAILSAMDEYAESKAKEAWNAAIDAAAGLSDVTFDEGSRMWVNAVSILNLKK